MNKYSKSPPNFIDTEKAHQILLDLYVLHLIILLKHPFCLFIDNTKIHFLNNLPVKYVQ